MVLFHGFLYLYCIFYLCLTNQIYFAQFSLFLDSNFSLKLGGDLKTFLDANKNIWFLQVSDVKS